MRKVISIFLLAICGSLCLMAQSVEREQQFTYNYYAALRELHNQNYPTAMMLLQLCETIQPDDAKVQELLGMMYDALGRDDLAFRYAQRACQLSPYQLWPRYVGKLMSTGVEADRKEAIHIVEAVVKHDPKNSEAWEALLPIYQKDGAFKQAIRAQDKLDELRGYDGMSAMNRYRTYVMWGKPNEAIHAIDTYLKEDPTNLQFLLFRIQLYEVVKKPWPVLEQAYQGILAVDPQNALILNNYAYGLCTRHKNVSVADLKRAERMSETAIRQQPDNATYLDTYAWVLHLQGQDVLAAFYIRKALSLADESDKHVIQAHYDQICK